MAVEVHPDHWPVQARGDLFDMGGFACAVIALNHNAAIVFKASQDGHGRLRVKAIALIDLWHIFSAGFKPMHKHICFKAKDFLYIDLFSRLQASQLVGIAHYSHGRASRFTCLIGLLARSEPAPSFQSGKRHRAMICLHRKGQGLSGDLGANIVVNNCVLRNARQVERLCH